MFSKIRSCIASINWEKPMSRKDVVIGVLVAYGIFKALSMISSWQDWSAEHISDFRNQARIKQAVRDAIEVKNNPELSSQRKKEWIQVYKEKAHEANRKFTRGLKCSSKAINDLDIEVLEVECTFYKNNM